jgi:hypothetical protein
MSGRGREGAFDGVESEDLEEDETQEGIEPGRGVTLTFW